MHGNDHSLIENMLDKINLFYGESVFPLHLFVYNQTMQFKFVYTCKYDTHTLYAQHALLCKSVVDICKSFVLLKNVIIYILIFFILKSI